MSLLELLAMLDPSSSDEGDLPVAGPCVLKSADLEGLAKYVEERDPRNVICMVGAGLSTAAGIPDFRSPGTGLYDNLQRYKLPRPEAVFDLDYFKMSPNAFYDLAKELWPTGKKYAPTLAHYFLTMLEKEGRLLRCYTQNIDMLEQLAGLSEDKVIAAHGNFSRAHALNGREVPVKELESAVFTGIEACRALEKKYGALVKPDIVFFGEGLPERFFIGLEEDFPRCDLLIVLGTSLAVGPFNQLVAMAPPTCPRVLVNREPAGLSPRSQFDVDCSRVPGGFCFTSREPRDVFLQGDCDVMVRQFCNRLGWAEALSGSCRSFSSSGGHLALEQGITTPVRQRKLESPHVDASTSPQKPATPRIIEPQAKLIAQRSAESPAVDGASSPHKGGKKRPRSRSMRAAAAAVSKVRQQSEQREDATIAVPEASPPPERGSSRQASHKPKRLKERSCHPSVSDSRHCRRRHVSRRHRFHKRHRLRAQQRRRHSNDRSRSSDRACDRKRHSKAHKALRRKRKRAPSEPGRADSDLSPGASHSRAGSPKRGRPHRRKSGKCRRDARLAGRSRRRHRDLARGRRCSRSPSSSRSSSRSDGRAHRRRRRRSDRSRSRDSRGRSRGRRR